jgi:hypothetical protein
MKPETRAAAPKGVTIRSMLMRVDGLTLRWRVGEFGAFYRARFRRASTVALGSGRIV